MLARVFSSAVVGLDGVPVEVEVDIQIRTPSFTIVGLLIKQLKNQRKSAQCNKEYRLWISQKRMTVNLAPADLPKEGASYDLPIALGILIASGQILADVSDAFFTGELSLTED